jgi:hypothetical protein
VSAEGDLSGGLCLIGYYSASGTFPTNCVTPGVYGKQGVSIAFGVGTARWASGDVSWSPAAE